MQPFSTIQSEQVHMIVVIQMPLKMNILEKPFMQLFDSFRNESVHMMIILKILEERNSEY